MNVEAAVRRAEELIDASGVADPIEAAIIAGQDRPGRPRELSVRTLLVALVVLAQTGTMHLIRIPPLLNDLDDATRIRLGVNRAAGVSRRQVERLYGQIEAALDDGGYEAFDAFCDAIIGASIDPAASATKSIAIDATGIETWGTRRAKRRSGIKTCSDPDANWRGKSNATPWRKPMFGYDLTIAATIAELNGPDVPLQARAIRFRPAVNDTLKAGRAVIKAVFEQQDELGDVLADREYTKRIDGSDFILPIRALGGEPVFDLTKAQLGARGTTHGAIMIDGHPHSPATPASLHHIPAPPVNADLNVLRDYQDKIARRAKYALEPNGSRLSNGAVDYQCPAAAGKLSCPLQPTSPLDAFPVTTAPSTAAKGSVCAGKYKRFHPEDAPLSQRELFGTPQWRRSFNRQSRAEGFFGNLRNEACENLKRGTIRVRGLIKTGILVTVAVAAVNLRLARSFAQRPTTPAKPKLGRPKRAGIVAYADIFHQDAGANAPPTA